MMRAATAIARVQLLLAMAALVVMGLVTGADVALKYAFTRPITGAYDLTESLLPVVVFHGLPATLLRRQNIVIDLVDHLAGAGLVAGLKRLADAVMLVIAVAILAAMLAPALQAFEYGDRKLELGLPLAFVWAAAMLGMAGSAFVAACLIVAPSRAAR